MASRRSFVQRLAWLVCCLGLQACDQDQRDKEAAEQNAKSAAVAASAAACGPKAAGKVERAVVADGATVPVACKLCVLENPRLEAGLDGLASSIFKLCNAKAEPETLALSATDFSATGWDGQPFLLNVSRRFTADPTAGQRILNGEDKLAANACISVRLELGKLSQSGRMTGTLRQGKDDIATLTAFRVAVPFALKVDGPNPAKVELSLVKGESTVVRIRNDDVMAYPVRWRFELLGTTATGCATILPKRTAALTLALDEEKFSWPESGFLRPALKEGRLVLERAVDAELTNLPIESVSVPVSATLRFHGELVQGFVNAAFVAVFLLLGILGSLVINYALPMQRKRVDLKQRLAAHEGVLSSQGDLIGSRPLNVLRVELRRLRAAVDAQLSFLPETEAELPRVEARIVALQKRIDLARDAGKILADVRDNAALAIHEAKEMADYCAAALITVEMASPTDADLQSAQASLAAAIAIMDATAAMPDPSAVTALATRAALVPASLNGLPVDPASTDGAQVESLSQDIATWKTLEDLLSDFRKDFLSGPTVAPLRADYIQAAQAVWKAEAISDFARMVNSAESAAVFRRRLDRAPELLAALIPGKQESSKQAQRLLREIKQNVSKADVLAALKSPGGQGPTIIVEPPAPNEYQLTVLRVSFPEPGLDVADARRGIVCKWTVNGQAIPGSEFSTHVFFERSRLRGKSFEVSVSLFDGASLLSVLPPASVQPTTSPDWLHSSTWLSLVSMSTTVVVVTIGLLATAQEKLQALDWPTGLATLLALGFGADVLKRVLSRS